MLKLLPEDVVQCVLACVGYCIVLIHEVWWRGAPSLEICMNENDILPAGLV